MTHQMTPVALLDNLAQNRLAGNLAAVVLLVDISGFTVLTNRLMQHGTEGAEVLAAVLARIFDPLLHIIYTQGGFVAAFGGDAFKAIFPCQSATEQEEAYPRAVLAAEQIRRHMPAHAEQTTRFGLFQFSVKTCLADGVVAWGIWQGAQTSPRVSQQAAYYFDGAALDACMALEAYSTAGEVLLTQAVYARLPAAALQVESVAEHWRLLGMTEALAHNLPLLTLAVPDAPGELATRFFPRSLLQMSNQGEFRPVVTLFLNLQAAPQALDTTFQQTFFRLLAQYGGYLCRVSLSGSGQSGITLLLFWGAPISHENDVARALSFVQALQTGSPVPLRAGVTTSLAYAGFVGSALREEYTCYGAYVNQAVRQMTKAAWGEIWLDAETARQAQAAFAVASHGQFVFKGFDQAQPIFLLGTPHDFTATFYQGEMVGRQAELAQLQATIQPIFAGHFAGVILITGEAGMGKSRLVHELQRRLAAGERREDRETRRQGEEETGRGGDNPKSKILNPQWFLGQTDEILRQPLNPFRYWLRSYFHQSTSAGEAANKAAFTAKLADLLASLNLAGLGEARQSKIQNLKSEITRTRSFLGALVDLHWPDSLYAQVEPQLRFENTLAALKSLILAESLRQPVILHLEDVHWLDQESRTFLARLFYNVAEYPLAIMMTMRPAEETREHEERAPISLGLEEPQVTVSLTTLTRAEIVTLATAQLQGPPAPALTTLLLERAEGNPFFAEQLLHYLQEQGWLTQGPDGWQVRTEQTNPTLLPRGARALLVARLDRLPQPVKEVVQTAAVLGREFDTQVLAQMVADDPMLADKLAVADQAAIWSAMTQARYLFRHALLREAAYDMQLRARLRLLHQRAGDALQQVYSATLGPYFGELAHHYDQAEAHETAVQWYGQAGEQALKQYANDTANRYFRRALELTPLHDIIRRYPLLLGSEAAHNWLGQRQPQQNDLTNLEAVTALLNDDAKRSEVMLRKTAFHLSTGRYQEAASYAEQAVKFAVQAGDALAEARAYHRWGRAFWQAGEYSQAYPYLEQALRLARTKRGRLEEAQCFYDLAVVDYFQADFEAALTQVRQASQLYAEMNDKRGESICLSLSAVILDRTGKNEDAIKIFEQTLQLCKMAGWRYAEARFLVQSGNNYLNLGKLELSQAQHEQAIAICQEIGDQESAALSLDALGLLCHFQHKLIEAQQYYNQALTIHRLMNDRHWQGYGLTHLGYTLAELQEWEKAAEAFDQARAIRHERAEGGLLLDTLAGCALVALAQNETEKALRYVDEILTWIATNGIAGTEFPVQVYLICYQVLQAKARLQPEYHSQAVQILEAGYQCLQERANRIQDVELRHGFIQNLPFHLETALRWQAEKHTQI